MNDLSTSFMDISSFDNQNAIFLLIESILLNGINLLYSVIFLFEYRLAIQIRYPDLWSTTLPLIAG